MADWVFTVSEVGEPLTQLFQVLLPTATAMAAAVTATSTEPPESVAAAR